MSICEQFRVKQFIVTKITELSILILQMFSSDALFSIFARRFLMFCHQTRKVVKPWRKYTEITIVYHTR